MSIDSIQIHLNSKYADSYIKGNHSDCVFNLPLIEVPLQHHIYISVVHCVIPYTFYNINATNNALHFNSNSVERPILYITQGNYNAIQLASYLSSSMSAYNIRVSYNSITNKFTFSNVNNAMFYIYNDSQSTCLSILGFQNSTLSQFTLTSGSLTSINSANMQTKHCICIQSNFISGNINNYKKNENTILCSIPINTQPYSMIAYTPAKPIRTNIFNNLINLINLRIVDQNNETIDLNGQDWSITLQLDVEKFV